MSSKRHFKGSGSAEYQGWHWRPFRARLGFGGNHQGSQVEENYCRSVTNVTSFEETQRENGLLGALTVVSDPMLILSGNLPIALLQGEESKWRAQFLTARFSTNAK
jgi:hypothetical protein